MKRPFKDKRPIGPIFNNSSYSDEVVIGSLDNVTRSQLDIIFNNDIKRDSLNEDKVVRIVENIVGGFYDISWIAFPETMPDNILVGISNSTVSSKILVQIRERFKSRLINLDTNLKLEDVRVTCPVSREEIIDVLK